MQNAEIELKFPIADLDRLQARLPSLGFHLDTPRTFEQNTLYDTPARTLQQAKQILRIRRYGDLWTLTHKRKLDPASDDAAHPGSAAAYKVRIETETHVDDGPALAAIFEQMGYSPVFRYEKFRTEWSQATSTIGDPLGGPLFHGIGHIAAAPASAHLVLDETPIGNYAELEGPPAWIDEMLTQLGVDPATCLTDSYGRLFLAWKERTGSSAEHLTFDEIAASALLSPALL